MHNEALVSQFGMCDWLMDKYLDGLTEAEALKPGPTGNTINWLVGHLAIARNHALFGLGGQRPWPVESLDRYARGKPPLTPAEKALPLADLKRMYMETSAPLAEKLGALTPQQAAAKAPFSPLNNPNETVGSLFATLAFHEGYHLGQIGMLRRAAGKPGLF